MKQTLSHPRHFKKSRLPGSFFLIKIQRIYRFFCSLTSKKNLNSNPTHCPTHQRFCSNYVFKNCAKVTFTLNAASPSLAQTHSLLKNRTPNTNAFFLQPPITLCFKPTHTPTTGIIEPFCQFVFFSFSI